ncbi:ABC transporter substrate-binding protein [Rhizobium sp. Leaf384]|uniref:ABC transporter substrate-binding protein n=1 Tax=unclassified Rhizobium TaxID=2613769 RepID=UPI000713C972|nr:MULTISPECIES: extracellular solute-binding protein [unclassified Rhizobium]KQS75146.1 ABC transporter substrate-binding protein [Rhizobium sp. Leaf384]KQS75269.1 ABC transporter substrate-binding protein [Rhizobium sp. Leaf383]
MHFQRISKTFAAVALAGSSLFATTAAFAGEITVWCWDPNFNVAIMKEAGARYTAKHPETTFNIVDFAKADVEQKLQTALTSGTTDALPDIVLIEDYGAQKYLQSFPGAFAPMSDTVDYAGFAPYKVKLMTVEDKVYGMPFDSGVTGLYYRKDYLEQAGFKPSDMQDITWDRFIEIGKVVEEKTGKKMLGLDITDAGFTRILMQSAGQWYFDAEGNLSIENNTALKAALETQQKILKANIYKPAAGWTDWVGTFTSGDVATVTTGVWITGTVKAQADQSGKWGVAPLPSLGIEGATHASNLGGSSWYVIESSAEKKEAIDFLNEIYAKDVSFYQDILTTRGAVGSLMAARTGDAYMLADPFFGGEKVWQNFSDWLSKVPAVNYGIFTNEVDTAVTAHLPSLAQGADIPTVLKEIQSQAEGQIQ